MKNYKKLLLTAAATLFTAGQVIAETVQISSIEDLQKLAALCNDGSKSGQTADNVYELTQDLDLSSISNWTPMGGLDSYPGTAFKGTFDGKGHTIKNLKCEDTHAKYATAALFGAVSNGATIKNLTLENVDIHSTHYAAAFVAYEGAETKPVKFENCHVKGGKIVSTPELVNGEYDNGDKVGGLIGYTVWTEISNCTVEGVTIQGYRDIGGLAGYIGTGGGSGSTVKDNTVSEVTLVQDNTNGYKTNSDGSLQDLSNTVGEVVGGRSNSTVKTQAADATQNKTESVTVAEPVYVAKIGEANFGSLAAAIAAATEGQKVEILVAGTYTLPAVPQNITIKGAVEDVVVSHTGSGNIANTPNGVTFEGITFELGNNNYHGFQTGGKLTMKNCVINGKLFSYKETLFNGCTFNNSSDYCMWIYGGNVTYTGCTINCAGKFANVYNEGNDGGTPWNVVATGCTFNSTKANKAAFNVKATCGSIALRFEVKVEGCEAKGEWPAAGTTGTGSTGDLVVLNALVQVDDIKEGVSSVLDVASTDNTVNGVKIEDASYSTYTTEYNGTRYVTLAEAIDAAAADGEKNIVVSLINDAKLTIGPRTGNKYAIGGTDTESITINGAGHTLTFMTTDTDWNSVATKVQDTKLVLNNITIDQGGKNTKGTWNSYDIYFYGDVELTDVVSNRPLAFDQDATLKNVTVNNEKDVYGIWIVTNGQNVSMDNVTVNVPNGRAIAVKDQYVNTAPETTTALKVENSTFVSAKKGAILVTAKYGAQIEANNLDISQVKADSENAVWIDEDLANQYDQVSVTGDVNVIPEGGVEAYTFTRTTGKKVNGYYNALDKAVTDFEDGQTINLAEDFTLTADVNVAKSFTLILSDFTLTPAEKHLLLAGDVVVTTDKTAGELFKAAAAGAVILQGTVENGYTYTAYTPANNEVNVENTTITLGAGAMVTFASSDDVDFSSWENIKAYVATGLDGNNLVLWRVTRLAAGEGVLLISDNGGTETVVKATDADITSNYANILVGVTAEELLNPTDGDYTNLVLSKSDSDYMFCKITAGTIPAGKAYLHVRTADLDKAASRGLGLVFFDETNGISQIENGRLTVGNSVYDLQGRRVAQPVKGRLYIVNNKKVVY